MRKLMFCCLALFVVAHDNNPTALSALPKTEEPTVLPVDVTVSVVAPFPLEQGGTPIPDVSLSCVQGCEDSQGGITDSQGRFTFVKATPPLTIRAEKHDYITKEMSGVRSGSKVILGNEWPAEARGSLRRLEQPDGLLLQWGFGDDRLVTDQWGGHYFCKAVASHLPTIAIRQLPRRNMLSIMEHALRHAHQDALTPGEKCLNTSEKRAAWEATEQGVQWRAALEEDENNGLSLAAWTGHMPIESEAEFYTWWLRSKWPLRYARVLDDLCEVTDVAKCRYMERWHGPRPARYTANWPPEPVGTLAPLTIEVGEAAVSSEVQGAFRDWDGDALTYAAASSAPAVASVTVSGSRMTVAPVASGTATATVWATDIGGSNTSASQRFTVTVTAPLPFTDDPLVPGVTPIKALHFTELRARIDAVLVAAGLEPFSWTDPVLTAGATPVRRRHLDEMRAMLDLAYERTGRASPRWTDPVSVGQTTPIKAVHLVEVRAAAKALPVTPDFVGQVLIPTQTPLHNDSDNRQQRNRPVPEVTVTIVSGTRSGESAQTDHEGRYTFPELGGDEIHIRLEKVGYEPKEAIVSRNRPTTLPDRVPLGYRGPQERPGTVLIGLRWPDYIRPALQQMRVVPDLLLIAIDEGASYSPGVVEMSDPTEQWVMAHEVCHAHQHWTMSPRGSNGASSAADNWKNSPEGLAYRAATDADIKAVGRDTYSSTHPSGRIIYEAAADACSCWLDIPGVRQQRPDCYRAWQKEHAPNRYRWAEEWLPK